MNHSQYYIVDESSGTIRALAREALRGKWLEAALAALIVWAIMVVPSMVFGVFGDFGSLLNFAYTGVVGGPAALGLCNYFLELFRQRSGGLDDMRFGIDYASKAILVYLHVVIRVWLWSLLFVIPGIIAAMRYSMAFYVLADNPTLDPVECLYESSEMMDGNKMKLFLLSLTFIGWSLLATIPFFAIAKLLLAGVDSSLAYFDPAAYNAQIARIARNPLLWISMAPQLLVTVYTGVSTVAFFNLANGSLSIRGDSYFMPPQNTVPAPRSESPMFTKEPAEPATPAESTSYNWNDLSDLPDLPDPSDKPKRILY